MKKLSILIAVCLFFITGCSSNAEQELFNNFADKLASANYEELYSLLSSTAQENISEEDFITKYTNIYSGIEASDFTLEMGEIDTDKNVIPFTLTMTTQAGEITRDDYQLPYVKEDKELKINWSESLIFPTMESGDKVRLSTETATRGSILDRNGEALAYDGTLFTVGIHPSVFNEENVENKIKELASILDISEETITKKLEANTNPEYFVPLVDLVDGSTVLTNVITANFDGVLTQSKQGRVYKDDEAFGRLLGYIRAISAEELEKAEAGIYTSTSLIGKAGLEQVYESTLRGIDGVEIYIERNGEKVETLAKKEPENGQDIKLTIDSALQSSIYQNLNGEKGSATATDPTTGEVLALVSSPSYNSNWFTTYMTKTTQEYREKIDYADESNRFASVYSPGSTFKLITATAGLEAGTLDPSEYLTITGEEWQADSSWGNYSIHRINEQTSISLTEAVKYSDNIYFAMNALEMGSDALIETAEKFTIGSELSIGYPISDSQISNTGKITGNISIADTGYGQGEIMVSTLNMALAYSALSNNGNIMTPTLILTDDYQPSVLSEAIASEHLTTLQDAFTKVVEDSDGTGHLAYIDGVKLAGKTGTAEIKSTQGETGSENGWFVATDLDNASISIAVVVEEVQDGIGTLGVVSIVKNILQDYLK